MSVLLNKVCVCRYLSSILCPDSNDITLLPADGTSSTGGRVGERCPLLLPGGKTGGLRTPPAPAGLRGGAGGLSCFADVF